MSSSKINKEKNLERETQIEILEKLGFIYNSFKLYYKKNSNGIWSKKAILEPGWEKKEKSYYDSKKNGVYVVTGKKSEIFVVDIDDEEKCSELKKMLDEDCEYIVKTKKGYHYYYKYDEEIMKCGQYPKYGFDIRAEGGMIYSPPTYYKDELGSIIKYEIKKIPSNYKIKKIEPSIKIEIIRLIENSENKKRKKKDKKLTKEMNEETPNNKDTSYMKQNLKDKPINETIIKTERNINNFYDLLDEICENFNCKRSEDFGTWINVGFALKPYEKKYNINTFKIWCNFASKCSEKFDLNEHKEKWVKFREQGHVYNIFSLLRWLKEDNPIKYNEISEKYKNLIDEEKFYEDPISTGDYIIKVLYKNNIKSQKISTQTLIYIFNEIDNIWEEKDVNEFESIVCKFLSNFFEDNKMKEEKKIFLKNNNITEITKYILRQTKQLDFIENLDTIRDVLNFKNGLLNLKTGTFRKRNNNDMFSRCEKYDYNENIDENIINEIRDDLIKVCNDDKNLLEDYLSFFGYAITGEVYARENILQRGTEGSNGKSTMYEILASYVLTNYVTKTSGHSTLAISSKQSDISAFLTNIILSKARLCFVEEINEKQFNTSLFKELTGGGETYRYRQLFGINENQYQIFCKFAILTNKTLNFDSDNALNSRLAIINHENEFYDADKLKIKIEERGGDSKGLYEKNHNTIKKYEKDEYKNGLIHLLLKYAMKFYENKSVIYQTKIKQQFEKLNENNDPIIQYLKENTYKTENEKIYIGKNELYDDFLYNFYNRKYKNKQPIIIDDFKKKMKTLKGKYYIKYDDQKSRNNKKGCYIGIGFNTNVQDLEDTGKMDNQDLEETEKTEP